MSNKTLNYVWEHSQMRGSHLLLMIAIADMANDDGVCWPGKANLAHKCRVSKRHLIRLIQECERAGELFVEVRKPDKEGEDFDTNVYTVAGMAKKTRKARRFRKPKPAPEPRPFPSANGVSSDTGVTTPSDTGVTTPSDTGVTLIPTVTPIQPKDSPSGDSEIDLDEWFTPYEDAKAIHGAPQTEFERMVDAVCEAYSIGGEQAKDYAAMLRGTAKTGEWKKYRIEGGITADEFRAWIVYYKTVQQPGATLAKEAANLSGYIYGWINAGKPDLRKSNGNGHHNPFAHVDRAAAEQDANDSWLRQIGAKR